MIFSSSGSYDIPGRPSLFLVTRSIGLGYMNVDASRGESLSSRRGVGASAAFGFGLGGAS